MAIIVNFVPLQMINNISIHFIMNVKSSRVMLSVDMRFLAFVEVYGKPFNSVRQRYNLTH